MELPQVKHTRPRRPKSFKLARKGMIGRVDADRRMYPVARCCEWCDRLFCHPSLRKKCCSDSCTKNRMARYSRKRWRDLTKHDQEKCSCGELLPTSRHKTCHKCKVAKYRVEMPNGQVFDNSHRRKPSAPKPESFRCLDCDCKWYRDLSSYYKVTPTRCIQCQRKHAAKQAGIKNSAAADERYRKIGIKRFNHKKVNGYRARAGVWGAEYCPDVTLEALGAMHKMTCQLCGDKVVKTRGKLTKETYNPKMWTLDHIVPLSKGGGHTWDNVQLACSRCNSTKSDKVQGQLGLRL